MAALVVLASLGLAGPANAASFVGVQTAPTEWTYTLTYAPMDNYAVCPAPGNVATITLSGLAGVVSASQPTSTDFDAGGDAVNRQWLPQVSAGGSVVTWTHLGPGTGNYATDKHVYGFKVQTATPTESGLVHVGSTAFSVDVSVSGPCPVQPADDRNFTATTQGPVGPVGAVQLYVTEGNYFGTSLGSLIRIDAQSGARTYLTAPGQSGVAMGFVTTAGKRVYWGGSEPYLGIPGVRRASLDGSSPELLVPSWMPEGVAVDETHGKLYWAEAAQHVIRRANLDGADVEDLVTGVGCCYIASPMGIALDVPHGKLYWAAMAHHTIQRSNLDGSDVETLVTVAGWPSGISIDSVHQKLYWAEQNGDVKRSNLDGTNIESLITGFGGLMGLALDPVDDKLYLTAERPGRVMSANLDGSEIRTIADDLAAVVGIAIVRTGDTTPPQLTVPEPIVVNATRASGALVTYSATATDDTDPNPTVTCTPASGSIFPIGTTVVTCTATDSTGNSSTATFTIQVKGADQQLQDLALGLAGVGPGSSLLDKVTNAQRALASGDAAEACKILNAFVNEVNAQTNKKITSVVAGPLVTAAKRIQTVLAC